MEIGSEPGITMKKLIFFAILMAGGNILSAQELEKAVSLIQPQEYYINSYLNLTGQSSLILEVDLPPNTIKWYYTVAAARTKELIRFSKAQFTLLAQLTRIIDQTGTAAKALTLLTTPPGNDYCNVYLLASAGDAKAFNQEFSLKNYQFISESSRENIVSGTVEVTQPERVKGKQYLGFYNPSAIYGVTMVVEVVAIIKEEKRINGWSAKEKEQLYTQNRAAFIENRMRGQWTEKQASDLYRCIIDKITATHTPFDLSAFATYELEEIIDQFVRICQTDLSITTGLPTADTDTPPLIPIEDITGVWQGDRTEFHFYPDGSAKWIPEDQKEFLGSWKIAGDLLHLKSGDISTVYQILELKGRRLVCRTLDGQRIILKAARN